MPHGPAAEYDRSGHLVQTGSFKNGVKHGTWIRWYRDGTRHAEAEYHDGALRRRAIWFQEERTIHSIRNFEDRKEHGVFATWYPNGARMVVGGMSKGEYHGVWMWYDENGFRYEKGEFSRGERSGKWTDWAPDGSIEREYQYSAGSPASASP